MNTRSVEEDFDFLFKVVIIGDSGVGKTNLLSQFIKKEFIEDNKPTIGVEFSTKTILLDDSINVKCQFWDTAGQERYRSITSAYYRGSVGALILYDVTNRNSFNHVAKWLEELQEHSDQNIQILVIGNKSDLEKERVVTTQDGIDLAKEKNIGFLETSALQDKNVEAAFLELIKIIYENTGEESNLSFARAASKDRETIQINQRSPEQDTKKSGCC